MNKKERTLVVDATTEHNETSVNIVERPLMELLKEDIENWRPNEADAVDEIMAALKADGHYEFTYEDENIFAVNITKSPLGTQMAQVQCWGDSYDVLERTNTTYIELPVPDDRPKPCVVMMHTFDSEVAVYEYPTQEAADEALVRLYTEYLETEKKEGSHLNEGECFCRPNEGYAKVTWADGEVTDFGTSYITKEVQS